MSLENWKEKIKNGPANLLGKTKDIIDKNKNLVKSAFVGALMMIGAEKINAQNMKQISNLKEGTYSFITKDSQVSVFNVSINDGEKKIKEVKKYKAIFESTDINELTPGDYVLVLDNGKSKMVTKKKNGTLLQEEFDIKVINQENKNIELKNNTEKEKEKIKEEDGEETIQKSDKKKESQDKIYNNFQNKNTINNKNFDYRSQPYYDNGKINNQKFISIVRDPNNGSITTEFKGRKFYFKHDWEKRQFESIISNLK